MQIVGEIENIGPETQINESFAKKEVIIKTVEQYPQYIKVEFHNNNINHLDPWQEGENVKVNINIRGRKYTKDNGDEEVFNTIVGWKIERA